MQVSHVPPESLESVWLKVQPMVSRGLTRGAGDSLTGDDICRGVLSGDLEMWAVHDGPEIVSIVVLRIVRRARGLVVIVVLVAGRDFSAWGQRIQSLIQDYAGLIGAVGIEATARPGMAKWLSAMGWRRKAEIMELDHGRS